MYNYNGDDMSNNKKKKRKVKRNSFGIIFILIIFILFVVFGFILLFNNTDNKDKLSTIGYSNIEIKTINKLTKSQIKTILKYDYNSNLVYMVESKNYDPNKLDLYMKYTLKYKDKEYLKIFELINNKDFKEDNVDKYVKLLDKCTNTDGIVNYVNNYGDKDIDVDDNVLAMIGEKYFIAEFAERYSNYYKKHSNLDYNKVIAIAGNYGSGKSLITALLGRAGKKLDIKTIIVDFDVINSSINTLFRVPKYNIDYKNNKLKNIIKISENLDIFCGVNMLFTEDNKINYDNVKTLFDDFRRNYNLILIDTSSETTLKYIKTVLYNVDKIVFLIEPNLLEIKKAEKLLEIYIEDWGVSTNKFDIVLNKVTAGSIDDTILNNIFNNFKIIEKIDFSNKS